ncbi:unnamed protein product [Heterobilharzia americana]|nr:unnamed protein product [Heterobilharzia americana]
MTSRRVAVSAVNWSELYAKCPKHQLDQYRELKAKTDDLVSKISSLPESLPLINWDYYSRLVPNPGLVEKFKKQYASLSVEYPKDASDFVGKVRSHGQVMMENARRHADACRQLKSGAERMKKSLSRLPPVDEMLPEYKVAYFGMANDDYLRPAEPINLGDTTILNRSAPVMHWDFS